MEIDNREAVMNAIDDGLVDARDIVLCLVKYMSQDDVKDCMKVNELWAPEILLIKEGNVNPDGKQGLWDGKQTWEVDKY